MSPSRALLRSERGSAGLVVVVAAMLVLAVAAAAVVWGSALVARHRAGRTADLAALAAASAVQSGAPEPCQAAGRVAGAARAVVESCTVLADLSVLVVVRVTPPALGRSGWVLPPARARARAGMAE